MKHDWSPIPDGIGHLIAGRFSFFIGLPVSPRKLVLGPADEGLRQEIPRESPNDFPPEVIRIQIETMAINTATVLMSFRTSFVAGPLHLVIR